MAVIAISIYSPQTPSANNQPIPVSCGEDPLRFINSDILDSSIESRVIGSCEKIELLTTSGMTLDAVSPRLDRWLVYVVNNGGTVNIRSDAEREMSRGLGSTALKAFASFAWDAYLSYRKSKQEKTLAKAAGQYNATIYVDETSSRITAVLLTRREK